MKRIAEIILILLLSCKVNIYRGILGPSDDTKNLVYEGEKALQERKYSKALEIFNRVLSENPALSRARLGRVKARMGLQVSVTQLAAFAEKMRGKRYGDTNGRVENGEPLIKPSDFNFADNQIGIGEFLCFARDNFVDLHEIIFGYSDGEISRYNTSLNIDFSAFSLLTSVLTLQYRYPSFNAFWNDTLQSYILNLNALNIPNDAPELFKMESYLKKGVLALENAISHSPAHELGWLNQYREILWEILQDVQFYRSL